jgi:hypothetical protein
MQRPPLPSPEGGEGGTPASEPAASGDGLFERLAGQLDQRDAQLLETMRAEITASIAERLTRSGEAAGERTITQALRAAVDAAGGHDFEIIDRLIGRDGIGVDEAGTVSGVAEAIARLKQAKPFLFGAQHSTGGTAKTPRPAAPRTKSARDFSPTEWQAEKKRLGVRS